MFMLFVSLVFPGLAFTAAMAFLYEYIERKLRARIQRRIGPLYAGPGGVLQPFYDFLKLLLKEELPPENVDPLYYRLAPVLAAVVPVYGMTFIPVYRVWLSEQFPGDYVFTIFLFSFAVFATAAAGYAVYSPYTYLGVGRLVVQYSIYESFFALALALASLQTGALSFAGLLSYQEAHGPLALYQPLGLAAAAVALLAKLEKTPFDLPHAKQEIVAGWMTEYSGRGLALLNLSKEMSAVWGTALIAAVYLGGPLGPMEGLLGPLWFLVKMLAAYLVLVFASSLAGRVRVYGLAEKLWGSVLPLVLAQFALILLLRLWGWLP